MKSSELRADIHSIEPIPDADRDSTGPQQMWIWAGANIAPVNWALGALGIILKLGLWETIAVIVLGHFGAPDTWLVEIIIITLVMALQVGIGVYGFYAIRTFEKYTVPVTIVI